MKYTMVKWSTTEAPEALRAESTERLLDLWEHTETAEYSAELATVRGWLMDEIERRAPRGFDAWLDQDAPEDKDLRKFVLVNPMCLNCQKWRADCKGTFSQVWTGCIYKIKL